MDRLPDEASMSAVSRGWGVARLHGKRAWFEPFGALGEAECVKRGSRPRERCCFLAFAFEIMGIISSSIVVLIDAIAILVGKDAF